MSDSDRPTETDETDAGREWMLSFQRGDDAAFDRIVHEFEPSVRRLVFRYVRDAGRAEDLTQETFLRVLRSKDRYEPTAAFRTWLFTIATRISLNEIRGVRRRRRIFDERSDHRSDADSGRGRAGWVESEDPRGTSPAEHLESRELSGLIERWVDELPPSQRAALILRRVEELSYREVADVLEVSVSAVKSLLVRARETLRERLTPYLEDGRLPGVEPGPRKGPGPASAGPANTGRPVAGMERRRT